MISDIRVVQTGINSVIKHVQIKRAIPVVDASGAIVGFQVSDDWETLPTTIIQNEIKETVSFLIEK